MRLTKLFVKHIVVGYRIRPGRWGVVSGDDKIVKCIPKRKQPNDTDNYEDLLIGLGIRPEYPRRLDELRNPLSKTLKLYHG